MTSTDDHTPDAEQLEEGRVLPGRRARVHLADGTSFAVRITNRDYVRWDKTAPRQKWGSAQEVPFLAGTFLAWSAARREELTALTFDQFADVCEEVEDIKTDEESDVARPTRSAAAAGSA